jgi:hypothetical protein
MSQCQVPKKKTVCVVKEVVVLKAKLLFPMPISGYKPLLFRQSRDLTQKRRAAMFWDHRIHNEPPKKTKWYRENKTAKCQGVCATRATGSGKDGGISPRRTKEEKNTSRKPTLAQISPKNTEEMRPLCTRNYQRHYHHLSVSAVRQPHHHHQFRQHRGLMAKLGQTSSAAICGRSHWPKVPIALARRVR